MAGIVLTAMRKSIQAIKPGVRELIVSKQGSEGTGPSSQGEKGGGGRRIREGVSVGITGCHPRMLFRKHPTSAG